MKTTIFLPITIEHPADADRTALIRETWQQFKGGIPIYVSHGIYLRPGLTKLGDVREAFRIADQTTGEQ